LPRKGFIEGPKTTVTIQIPLYLERLIKKFCSSNRTQTEFAVDAFCAKLGVTVSEVMQKNRDAWKNGF